MAEHAKTDWSAVALTLLIGGAGALLARAAGLPLALLLGSLLSVGIIAAVGFHPFGRRMQVPPRMRSVFIPVIGVAIGGNFTPAVVAQMPGWWPSLLALIVYIPLAHWIGYRFYMRFGALEPATAYFGAVPGGLIESVLLGEQAGADARMLVLLQFLRLILTIMLVPVAFTLLSDFHVGIGGGMRNAVPLEWQDALILAAAGIVGFAVGTRLRFPAAPMTGPLLASALVHMSGLSHSVPPSWAVGVTQVVVGTVLGARFVGLPRGHLGLAARLALMNVAMGLTLAFAFAFALAQVMDQPIAAIFLAFAPGGVTEMSLIALSIQLSVVYVTVHHVVRIVLSVTVARSFSSRLRR